MLDPRCPTCGATIPENAPAGLCPVCVASSLASDLLGGPLGEESKDSVVPGFELQEILGEGASGVVWRARELDPPQRMVALKILKTGSADEQAGLRFEAEMSALARMDHPGIARVYRSGRTLEGQPFFAMEIIEGIPVTGLDLSLVEKLHHFQQLCEAIGHAHRRGIIHRDLKPSNVLLGSEDGVTHIKVIDFGIAKATDSLLTDQTLLTRAHQLLGTPAYMSPEQATLKSEAVDTRSDIYSLGVILYELLTGHPPIAHQKLEELPYDEILRLIRTSEPPRPSSLMGELSADLDWIVLKALTKDPSRRYETADALSRDLQRFLEGRAIEARPPTTAYRLGKYLRRHRGKVAAATLVLLALVAGSIVSTILYFQAEKNRQIAERNEQRAQEVFSRGDFNLASTLLETESPAAAVAHLVRSLRTDPENTPAARRLFFTLAHENWPRPVRTLSNRGQVTFFDEETVVTTDDFWHSRKSEGYPLILHSLVGQEDRSLAGMEKASSSIARSSDGTMLAIGDVEGMIRVWDLESGERTHEFGIPGSNGVYQLAFTDDGLHLVAGYWHRGDVRVWSLATGESVKTHRISSERGNSVFDLEPKTGAFVVGVGRLCQIVDLFSGDIQSPVFEHHDAVNGVRFVGSDQLVTWSKDSLARVWNREQKEPLMKLAHEASVSSGVLSPDAKFLLTGTARSVRGQPAFTRLWRLSDGQLMSSPLKHSGRIAKLTFSADGSRAASACEGFRFADAAVRVMSGRTGEMLAVPLAYPRGARSVALSHDGSQVAMSSRYKESAVFSIPAAGMRPLILKHRYPLWNVAFEGNGKLVAAGWGGRTRRWNARTGQSFFAERVGEGAFQRGRSGAQVYPRIDQGQRWSKRFHQHFLSKEAVGKDMTCFAHTAGQDWLVVGFHDGRVRFWSVKDERVIEERKYDEGAISAIAVSPDGQKLLTGTSKGVVRCWNVTTRQVVEKNHWVSEEVTCLAFSESGEKVAIGTSKGDVFLWRPEEGRQLGPFSGHGRVNHLSFSPDGQILASAGTSNQIFLHEVESGRQVAEPLAHIDTATYGPFLFWTPDSNTLVSCGSHDNFIRVWDVTSGRQRVRPMMHPTAAYAAALSPDGRSFLKCDDNRWARVWDIKTGEPLTPPLKMDHVALGCAFSPDGTRIACATLAGSVYVWDLPRVEERLPAEVLDFAEALAGFRFNEDGLMEMVPFGELNGARERALHILPSLKKDHTRHWLKWLLMEPEQRPDSPEQYQSLSDQVLQWMR